MADKDNTDSIHMESQQPAATTTTSANVESAPDPTAAIKTKSGRDKAAQFLKAIDTQHVTITPADNTRVLRKIDLRILPLILFTYCLQSLDKTTLSYASVFGLIEDTNLKGNQFSWLGSVVYVAQLVFQPLIAYLLVRFPIGKFIATMVFFWGAMLCCMTACKNFAGLMATRLLLGSFEASVAPTFVAIVQMWYRRREQTTRNAAWYAMLGVVNMLGSLLTYGLGHIDSTLRPYQVSSSLISVTGTMCSHFRSSSFFAAQSRLPSPSSCCK